MGFSSVDVSERISDMEAQGGGPNTPSVFTTTGDGNFALPPPRADALTDYFINDAFNSSPRFLRLSMYNAPSTSDVVKSAKVPYGAVSAPLAQLLNGEHGSDSFLSAFILIGLE